MKERKQTTESVHYHGNLINKNGVVHAIVTTIYRDPIAVTHISQCGLFNPGHNYPLVSMIQGQSVGKGIESVTCKLCKQGMRLNASLFNLRKKKITISKEEFKKLRPDCPIYCSGKSCYDEDCPAINEPCVYERCPFLFWNKHLMI